MTIDGVNQRGRFPVAVRYCILDPLALRPPTLQPRHVRLSAGLVQKDELFDVRPFLSPFPKLAPLADILAMLLSRVQSFF